MNTCRMGIGKRYAHAMTEHSTAMSRFERNESEGGVFVDDFSICRETRNPGQVFLHYSLFLSPFYVKYDREESIWGECGNCHLRPWPNLASVKLSYLYLLNKMSSKVVLGLCTGEEKRQLHSAANLAAIYGFAEGARVRHAR